MTVSTTSSSGARRRYLLTAALAVLAAMVLAVPAQAADTPFDFSAGDQYVETLPTTKGPRATDRPSKRRSGLSKQTKQRLAQEGGQAATVLEQVATSPELGAPATTTGGGTGGGDSSRGKSSDRDEDRGGKRSAQDSRSVPSAAIKAAGGGNAGIGWLALGLPLVTAIALGAFGVQRRRNRDAS